MDLNEFNRLLGRVWRAGDDGAVALVVFATAQLYGIATPPGYFALWLYTTQGVGCCSKGVVSGFTTPAGLSLPLVGLREACRKASRLALRDSQGLLAYEPLIIEFETAAVRVRCKGKSQTVRGIPLQFDGKVWSPVPSPPGSSP
jgi:hypothetical protein